MIENNVCEGVMKMFEKMSNKNKGIVFIVMEAFFFALMGTFVRLSGDLPVMEKAFFRNCVAMVIALAVLIKNKERWIPEEKSTYLPLFIRAAAGSVGIFCNFYAIDHLALADATMLNKLSPFFVIIFSFFVLAEKVSVVQVLVVIVAFVGSLFIIKPGFSPNSFASVVGFTSAVGAGLAYSMVRLCSQRGAKKTQIVFFFSAFSSLLSVPYLVFSYHHMTSRQLMFLLLAGCAAAGGQFSVTAAYSYAPAKEISIYDYSQLIFAAIIGYFLFGNIPDVWSITGYIIICGASFVMFLYNNKK